MRFLLFLLAGWVSGVTVAAESFSSGPVAKEKLTLGELMGVNGHTVLFKPQLYRPVATRVRDYHPVSWDLGENPEANANFPWAKNRVNWEQVYGSWRKEKWDIDVCLMFESIPVANWETERLEENAGRYGEAFARNFGPSGKRGLVHAVEIGNEPGGFSDVTYRRIFRAMAAGARKGDPEMKIATCALTLGKSHAYAKNVECLQGLDSLYDALNIHVYAQVEGWPTWRRSFPEDPQIAYLREVQRLIDWRDTQVPGKEIWITEFGWDATTQKPDPQTEFKRWEGSTEIQQAQWLVRSYLLWAAMDVDRAYVYFFNDDDKAQVHGSSGLTRNFQPKPAFRALARLREVLGDYCFAGKLVEQAGEVYAYAFVSKKNPRQRILAVWSPTGNNRQAEIIIP